MAATNEKVMAMVEEEIRKDPEVDTQALYDKAKKIDKGIGGLSARQFNARYPLQVKRRMAPPRPRRSRRRAPKNDGRGAVRTVLLDLAKEVASAEDKADVVDLVAGVDKYVDRVMKAVAGAA